LTDLFYIFIPWSPKLLEYIRKQKDRD